MDRSLSGPRLAERFGETLRNHRKLHPVHPDLVRTFFPQQAPELPPAEAAKAILSEVSSKQATFTFDELKRLTRSHSRSKKALAHILYDPSVVDLGDDRFTSRGYVEQEESLFRNAAHLASKAESRLDAAQVDQAIRAYANPLSDEQQGAIFHATTQQDLSLIVGRAGAGKTRLTQPLAAAYIEAGYRVRGAAPTGTAAQLLGEDASIDSRTLASYFHSWGRQSSKLKPNDVLIVDEASMIPVSDMSRLFEAAREGGAKLVLIGDPAQLPAIGAGDAFRGLVQRHEAAELSKIYRQAQNWQREASEALARADIESALRSYGDRGRLEWHTDRAQARNALVHQYFEDRLLHPQSTTLILARKRAEVGAINDQIRQARMEAGELQNPVRVAGKDFAAGDRILFVVTTTKANTSQMASATAI